MKIDKHNLKFPCPEVKEYGTIKEIPSVPNGLVINMIQQHIS